MQMRAGRGEPSPKQTQPPWLPLWCVSESVRIGAKSRKIRCAPDARTGSARADRRPAIAQSEAAPGYRQGLAVVEGDRLRERIHIVPDTAPLKPRRHGRRRAMLALRRSAVRRRSAASTACRWHEAWEDWEENEEQQRQRLVKSVLVQMCQGMSLVPAEAWQGKVH